MSNNLFNWSTKISQTSTGYGVTSGDNNSYAKYNIDEQHKANNTDVLSKKSNTSGKSIGSNKSDVKTQHIPTDVQSEISNKNNSIEKTPSELKNIKHIMYKLNGELSTIQAYKENYDKSLNDLKKKMQMYGIENTDNILDIIEQYPNIKTNTQLDTPMCKKDDVRYEHFSDEKKKESTQTLPSVTDRAKETVEFVHKCHVRYWWINAIVRLVTISVFVIMIYKLSQIKKK